MADVFKLSQQNDSRGFETRKKTHRITSVKNLDISQLSFDSETPSDEPVTTITSNGKKKKTSKRDVSARKKELSNTVEKCKESARARKKQLKEAEKTIELLGQQLQEKEEQINLLSETLKEKEKQHNLAENEKIQKLRNARKVQDDYIEAQTITIKELVNIIQRDDYSIDHDGVRTPPRQNSDRESDCEQEDGQSF